MKEADYPLEDFTVGIESTEIECVADVPGEEEARATVAAARETCGIDGAGWAAECARLRGAGVRAQRLRREVQCLRVGRGALCGVPCELFCECALEAAARAQSPLLLLNGYTNGVTEYVPSGPEWDRGGYEPVYSLLLFHACHGHCAPFRRDTADRIVDTALELWHHAMGPM